VIHRAESGRKEKARVTKEYNALKGFIVALVDEMFVWSFVRGL
jgi:hypothetical protein